jgi:4-hydroxy-tetrahydrodipicolinate reductase
MSRVGICGISGRMGRAISRILLERGHTITAAFEAQSSPFIGKDISVLLQNRGDTGITIAVMNESDLKNVDVMIDFSVPEATLSLLDLLKKRRIPIVIGTTGFSQDGVKRIEEASKDLPVLLSPNMSVGVNLLFKLTEIASKAFKGEYDIEVFEAHHRFKKDAPSGTAKKLVEIIKNAVPGLSNAQEISGREGMVGERGDKEIGVMAMRGGDIVGEHTVYFIGMEERIELTHRAASRDTFARGAVRVMEYLIDKKPGLYNMFDVLGI